jgi:hypothetical protein
VLDDVSTFRGEGVGLRFCRPAGVGQLFNVFATGSDRDVSAVETKISLFPSTTNRESLGRSASSVCFRSPRTGQRSRKPGTEDWLPKGGRELSPERNLPDRP